MGMNMAQQGGGINAAQMFQLGAQQQPQAPQQSAAGGYVREGSFRLDVNADHFFYESTTKRKIENNTQKK